MAHTHFSSEELEQYSRHLALPGWGKKGQVKIKKSAVLVVGIGGLGSLSSLYLAGAGVGRIGLVDDDRVALSNLHRQILYTAKDINLSKAALAEKRLVERNPHIHVQSYDTKLTVQNASEIIEGYDVIVDGTDNFATRNIINERCFKLDKPYVFGAVTGFDAQISVFHASRGPCLRCLFPNRPEGDRKLSGEQLAVLNTVPAIIGALQATEVIKLILNVGEPLLGRLLIYNALKASFNIFPIPKREDCEVCG